MLRCTKFEQHISVQATSGSAGACLAHAMGWHEHSPGDPSIISRYPMSALPGTEFSTATQISLDGTDRQTIVRYTHLGYDPYGPYDLALATCLWIRYLHARRRLAGLARSRTLKQASSRSSQRQTRSPCFSWVTSMTPSHLDWTDAAEAAHCGVSNLLWPMSEEPINAGLLDTYRSLHPDPVAHPGLT